MEGLVAGEHEVAGGLGGIGPSAGLVEMVGHVRRVSLGALAVDLLHRVGNAQVEALAAGEGEATYERLPD